jgi:hypothetical protein
LLKSLFFFLRFTKISIFIISYDWARTIICKKNHWARKKKLDSIFFLLLIFVGGQMPYDVFGPRMCWRLRSGNERKTFQFHKWSLDNIEAACWQLFLTWTHLQIHFHGGETFSSNKLMKKLFYVIWTDFARYVRLQLQSKSLFHINIEKQ